MREKSVSGGNIMKHKDIHDTATQPFIYLVFWEYMNGWAVAES